MTITDASAIVVTRGGYDISDTLDSLSGFGEVLVWDNSKVPDLKVYGRFAAITGALNRIVYVQDDDCIVDAAAIVAAYEPWIVTANSEPRHREVNAPLYRGGIAPIGWGAVFDRSAASVFHSYWDRWPYDEIFRRECDRVFTALNRVKLITVPFRHIKRPESMWTEGRHLSDFEEIRKRIAAIQMVAA